MDKTRYQLKTLNRQCNKLISTRTALKNRLIAALDQAYPGSNTPFTSAVREGETQKWIDFVKTFWQIDRVRGISLVTFTKRCPKWCRRDKYNFSSGKAAQIYADAQERIALLPKDSLKKMIIQQSVDSLAAVSKSVEQLKSEMWKLSEQLSEYSVVMDMDWVGDALGPRLMAEIGVVTQFAHRSAITAFAGVDL